MATAVNPRGNLWLNDKNKFGEKLLTKMGWSKGKGLGKNENGIQENIKVKLKNNNSGIGWKNKPNGIGTVDYDLVLTDLWENYTPTKEHNNDSSVSVASLENRSQKFKNRLHYRKFVHGKDISHYSEKDMQSIFVSRPTEEQKLVKGCAQENIPVKEDETNGFQNNLTKNVLNTVEYFNQKLKNKKGSEKGKNGASFDSAVEATAECFTSDSADNMQETECLFENNGMTKPSKRKKSKSMMTANENDEMVSECSSYASLNNGLDTSETDCKTKEYRKKKRKRTKSIAAVETDSVDSDSVKSSPDSSPTKKSKRRKKSKTELIEETSCENLYNNTSNSCVGEVLSNCDVKVGKKKRKKHAELYTAVKKFKSETISKMKSCLKNNLLKSSLKRQVSFNNDISFKTFDSELSVDSMDEEQVSSITTSELKGDLINENIGGKTNLKISENVEKTSDDSKTVEGTVNAETKTNFESIASKTFSPIKRPSVYNSWLESQRQALKMKSYKNMYQKIIDHDVLQSTNLTQIKGYGNWGY